MACSIFHFVLASAMLIRSAKALQVAPNSPCASSCVDSSDLDISDPNSSSTVNDDITCYDKDYASSAAGLKFERCMSCLQDSSYSQGAESDQAWFLYNLRYTFDYCIFGFPNATNVASTPCSTSTACGGLEAALTGDSLDATNLQAYGYCSADGSAMSDSSVAKCKACVSASDGQDYLVNFMTALEAGCQQQPATGTLIGLNDTVFATTAISATDPSASAEASSGKAGMPTTAIAGIAIGAIVVLLAIAGFLFVRYRKRRNRSVRLGGLPKGTAPKRSKHRPASSLSFRCQTHLSPRSPAFFPSPSDTTIQEEKQFPAPPASFSPNLISPESPDSKFSAWNSRPGFKSERGTRGHGPSPPLYNISTAAPTVPAGVYHSTSPKFKNFSPIDETTTPASTTSTKSTSHLLPLKPYNPAEYGISVPQMGTVPEATYASPTSGSTASPLISRAWDQKKPVWDTPLPVRVSSRPAINVVNVLGANKGKRISSNTGSPVESKEISVKFPGPPSPKRF
ncbi:hypothetical protein AB5N19_11457 [Seiridium cardinale]|uniref:LPXTG-domain-containing protein n=1 Tax=Seiridium cardinale TaxID=138064 RepID=A0ABR2X9H5_9PEZI